MSVTEKDGSELFQCYACGTSGDLYGVVVELAYLGWHGPIKDLVAMSLASADHQKTHSHMLEDVDSAVQAPYGLALHPFSETWLASVDKWHEAEAAKSYLAGRSVSPRVADRMDFRFDWDQNRVGVPVRDFAGRLMGFHGRDITGMGDPPYRMYSQKGFTNPVVWLGEHWIDYDEPVVLVESVFDMARVMEVADNVMAPLSAYFSRAKAERLNGVKQIVCLFDSDEAGNRATQRVIDWASRQKTNIKVFVETLPGGVNDPGDLSVDQITALLDGKARLRG